MVTFDAIAPDGTRERLRFETQAEADAVADERREAGHTIYPETPTLRSIRSGQR
jgi:hypothetical protein